MNTTIPVEKTLLGMVDSLESIVTGLRYVKSMVIPQRGSQLQKNPGELFVSFDGVGPRCWVGKRMDHALVGTPRVELPRFPGRMGSVVDRGTGSLRFIAWKHLDVALVVATDPNHISDRWLAFVPLASVTALRVEIPAAAAALPHEIPEETASC